MEYSRKDRTYAKLSMMLHWDTIFVHCVESIDFEYAQCHRSTQRSMSTEKTKMAYSWFLFFLKEFYYAILYFTKMLLKIRILIMMHLNRMKKRTNWSSHGQIVSLLRWNQTRWYIKWMVVRLCVCLSVKSRNEIRWAYIFQATDYFGCFDPVQIGTCLCLDMYSTAQKWRTFM